MSVNMWQTPRFQQDKEQNDHKNTMKTLGRFPGRSEVFKSTYLDYPK